MVQQDAAMRKTVLILVCALFCHRASPSTIGEQSQSQYAKDVSNNLNGQSFSQENHNAEKVSDNQNSLSENKNNQFVGAKDSGHYVNQDVNKKIFDDNKFLSGQHYNQDAGEKVLGVAQKKGHKKGHHNTGFRNSYHKDESSNNSSYFDDYNDEADQSRIQNGRGRYGNEAEKRYDTRKEDGVRHLQDNSKRGNYDRQAGTDARNENHRDIDRKYYQGDRRDLTQNQRGQSYGGRDREFAHAEAAPHYHGGYYERPLNYAQRLYPEPRRSFYDRPPLVPEDLRRPDDFHRQTITIYEDPRYANPYSQDVQRDNSEFVHLDVRPGSQRFQRYENYYEPRDWGVNRRSEINPLVFNYNRY